MQAFISCCRRYSCSTIPHFMLAASDFVKGLLSQQKRGHKAVTDKSTRIDRRPTMPYARQPRQAPMYWSLLEVSNTSTAHISSAGLFQQIHLPGSLLNL